MAVGLLIVVIAALLALAHIRQGAELRAFDTTQNLTRSVEQTIEGVIDTIDVALLASSDEISRQLSTGTVDRDSINRFLVRQTERLPHVAYVRALNESGEVIYGPGIPTPTANNSDREFFIRLRDDPNAGLFVAKPVFGRIAQKWIWPFARRINKPDGSFGGIVVAAVLVDELEMWLAQIKLKAGCVVSVRDAELGLIARNTFDSAPHVPPGDNRLSTAFKEALKTKPEEGTFISDQTTPDGVSRTYSYRRCAKYGFTVNVGIARDTILAEWRSQAWVVAGMVSAFMLTSLIFSMLLNRVWRRQELEIARQIADRESLYETQRIAHIGSYAYDIATNSWTSSDVLDDIFGIDSDYPRDMQGWLDLRRPAPGDASLFHG